VQVRTYVEESALISKINLSALQVLLQSNEKANKWPEVGKTDLNVNDFFDRNAHKNVYVYLIIFLHKIAYLNNLNQVFIYVLPTQICT
jgi:hypothetical protein